jgi:tRNA modification GTPase
MNQNLIIFTDNIVAIATAPGLGAIAVIRLAGAEAWQLIDRFFKGKKAILEQKSHSTHFGSLYNNDGKLLDEVLVTLFKNPHSYTGDDIVEISCHGSPFIQQQILELFLANGARLARPGEFTQRAFLNGKMDLTQAEAVGDLIASQNAAAHQVALRQMRGGFSSEIKNLREELILFAALIELELDFAEEDVEFANRLKLNELVKKIRTEIARLTQSFRLGNALKNGVSTVIAGRPNAGKSTLLNALLNENRAIVHETAGTTRDVIEEILTIDGIQFRLIDTAGIREATDQIERIGVEKTLEKVNQAAILIYLFDVVQTRISEVFADLEKLNRPDLQLLVVANKMDLLPQFRPEWLENPHDPAIPDFILGEKITSNFKISASQILTLSAKNEMNVPYLKEKLVEMVAGGKLDFESTIVTNARHVEALQRADAALMDVQTGFRDGISNDFVAQDIRRALAFLGEISGGTIHADDLLAAIFSKFCIGK